MEKEINGKVYELIPQPTEGQICRGCAFDEPDDCLDIEGTEECATKKGMIWKLKTSEETK